MFSFWKYKIFYSAVLLFLLFTATNSGRGCDLLVNNLNQNHSSAPLTLFHPDHQTNGNWFSLTLIPELKAQDYFTSSSRIKLERKHRKVIESTPELVSPLADGAIRFQNSTFSCSSVSSLSHAAPDSFLIRGPPLS
jgi:hypothetical protein